MELCVKGIITKTAELNSLEKIRNYCSKTDVSREKTYHEYENNLPTAIQFAIEDIKDGTPKKLLESCFNEKVENIDEMNELYISCIGADGSDKVFETMHIDGPFAFLPFCRVFRTIVTVQGNSSIFTEFPTMKGSYNLLTNEILAFDYDRNIHYIWKNDEICDNNVRIILKLHYIVVPTYLPKHVVKLSKKLHVDYNSLMRNLFLNSQAPNMLSFVINNGTVGYCYFHQYIGYWNLFLIFACWYFYTK